MQLNPQFIANIHDLYGQAGLAWLKALPATLKNLSLAWNFLFLHPLPYLSYSFVGLVKLKATGQTAVLKLVPKGSNLGAELRWLQSIKKGVPKVYVADEKRNAFIMEYLEPGSPLKELVRAGKDDAATLILCQAIRDLQAQQHAEGRFQHLADVAEALTILKGRFDARLLSQAETWFQELTQDRSQDVVLHGDLHHDNLLACGTGWKAIDPHGYIGDPAAEAGVMIRNPIDCFPKEHSLQKIIQRRLQLLADELPFDAQRIKAWCFCLTVLSAAWTLEGHDKVAELETQVAVAVDRVRV